MCIKKALVFWKIDASVYKEYISDLKVMRQLKHDF